MISPPEQYVLDRFRFLDTYKVESAYPDYSMVWVDVSSLEPETSLEFDSAPQVIIQYPKVDREAEYSSLDDRTRISYLTINKSIEYKYLLNSVVPETYIDNAYKKDYEYQTGVFIYNALDVVYALSAVIEREDAIIQKSFEFEMPLDSIIADTKLPYEQDFDSVLEDKVTDTSLKLDSEFGISRLSLILNEKPELDSYDFDVAKSLNAVFELPHINEEIKVSFELSRIEVDFSDSEPAVYFEYIIPLDSQILYEAEPPKVITCEEHCKEVGGDSCDLTLEIPVEVGSYNLIMKIGKDIRKMTGLPMQHFWDTKKKAVAGFVTFVDEKMLEIETVDGELIKLKLIPYNSWEKPSLDKLIK